VLEGSCAGRDALRAWNGAALEKREILRFAQNDREKRRAGETENGLRAEGIGRRAKGRG